MQLRLSPEQVAEMLHLSPQQIIALENDDFSSLPGPTYVRGYLRSYAQILGLPADDVVASYAQLNDAQRSARLSSLVPEPQASTRDGSVRFATFLVASILMVLAVVWWHGRYEGVSPGQAPLVLGPAASSPDRLNTAGTKTGAELPPEPSDDVTMNVEATSTVLATAPGIGADPVRLVLYTREASWADVRDARENRLLYTVLPARQRVTLVGTPPFRVFLGNPDSVTVEFNDENVDISRFKRGVVARFTLGAPTARDN